MTEKPCEACPIEKKCSDKFKCKKWREWFGERWKGYNRALIELRAEREARRKQEVEIAKAREWTIWKE